MRARVLVLSVMLLGCPGPADPDDAGAPFDAGSSADGGGGDDAGMDAGPADGGAPDSGSQDAGVHDAGTDAGTADAGSSPDGGWPRPWVVAAGGTGTCALHESGRVKCWGGYQSNERLDFAGDGPGEMGANLPFVNLGTGRTAKQLVVGASHVCALLDSDQVKCWGFSDWGQLGLGDQRHRGPFVGDMGDALPFVSLGAGRSVRALSAGDDLTCAILDDATLKCWGQNAAGALGQGDTVYRGVDAGQMGDALRPVRLGTGRTVQKVFAGTVRACALLDNDDLKCWGNGTDGALGIGRLVHLGTDAGDMGDALLPIDLGTGLRAVHVAHSGSSVCAIVQDGGVKCWGRNTEGQLALGDAQNRGDMPGEMGDALPFAKLPEAPVQLEGSAGGFCALFATGDVSCWGSNYVGWTGLGVPDNTSIGDTPATVGANLPRVRLAGPAQAISVGGLHVCATLRDGRVQCWGYNLLGMLGLGDTRDRGNDAGDLGVNLPFVDLGP